MSQVTAADIVITKVVAIPKPTALSVLLDTPINGHMPRKYVSTKLFVILAAIKMRINFSMD